MILGEGLNYSYTSKIIGKEETENFVFFSGNIPEYSGILSEIPEFFFSEFFRKIPKFFFPEFYRNSGIFFFGIFPKYSGIFFSEISEIPNSEKIPEFYQPY